MADNGRVRAIGRLLAALVVLSTLSGSGVAAPTTVGSTHASTVDSTASQSSMQTLNDTSAFVVTLAPDGSARVTLRLLYDLTEDAERTGFERLKSNASTFADSYATRLEPLATRASNETGREMTIRDPVAQFDKLNEGTTGLVELSVTWTNVASSTDETLVLAEPFDEGFDPDRAFVVRAPDGYQVASVAPNPDVKSSSVVAWNTSGPLDGLSVSFESTDSTDDQSSDVSTSSTDMPVGPEPVIALLTVAVVLGILGRRRD
ncbi:hypothetical protein GJR96_13275 [Haloferax sp. MBLA0076]|uniref:DUF7345 domain-containing protein n=1 Tax=Haloferax litoreum TaxID=2666140 RepID=A0A6A8GJ73_9EURY|nr:MULTISPECIES: hypothetical protein [Haloferax]KAB1194357.1 hypothetical protein Hfx1148_13215 [Haloferax sp. CBA1148]MRX22919.1 hypothetical protein [Haloferax litoreum]